MSYRNSMYRKFLIDVQINLSWKLPMWRNSIFLALLSGGCGAGDTSYFTLHIGVSTTRIVNYESCLVLVTQV